MKSNKLFTKGRTVGYGGGVFRGKFIKNMTQGPVLSPHFTMMGAPFDFSAISRDSLGDEVVQLDSDRSLFTDQTKNMVRLSLGTRCEKRVGWEEGAIVNYMIRLDEYAGISRKDFDEIHKIRAKFPGEVRQIDRDYRPERPEDLLYLMRDDSVYGRDKGDNRFDLRKIPLLESTVGESVRERIRGKRMFGKKRQILSKKEEAEFEAEFNPKKNEINGLGYLLSSLEGNSASMGYVVGCYREGVYPVLEKINIDEGSGHNLVMGPFVSHPSEDYHGIMGSWRTLIALPTKELAMSAAYQYRQGFVDKLLNFYKGKGEDGE